MYSTDNGTVFKIKGRHRRFIDASARAAEESEFPNYRHGALLVRGSSILNSAVNKSNHINWANKFCAKDRYATHHAELGAEWNGKRKDNRSHNIRGQDWQAWRAKDVEAMRDVPASNVTCWHQKGILQH